MYGRDLLGLFGSIYTVGYAALVVYLGGVFIGSAVGATGWLLMITDHQYARMILDWLLATFNVALTYAFVLRFGLVGAALGTSLAIAVQNRIQALLLRWFEGLWSFDRAFLTPVAAGFAMVVVGWTIRNIITGSPVFGAAVAVFVYVGSLSVLGIDPRDRLVVRRLTAEYRDVILDWLHR